MRALREYATCRTIDAAKQGAWAILNVAWSDRAIQQRFVAMGARVVLQAIIDDPASSAQAKEKAREALKKLEKLVVLVAAACLFFRSQLDC